MATERQIVVRLTPDDAAILDAIHASIGLRATSETIRFILRQYAKASGVVVKLPSAKRKRASSATGA